MRFGDEAIGRAFAPTLRALIQERGVTYLGLARRLADSGAPMSATTLHYWASGRSQPERPESLRALAVVERALGAEPGSLAALLPAPRPRGRARRGAAVPAEALWAEEEALKPILAELDCPYSGRRTLSLRERYRLDAQGREASVRVSTVLESACDLTDRFLVVYREETGSGVLPELRPLHGVRRGRVRAANPFLVAELHLDQALRRGERTLAEYEFRFDAPSGRCPGVSRRFAAPIREQVLEVVFDPELLPVRCYAWRQPVTATAPESHELRLAGDRIAREILLDAPAGAYGMTWEWQ